MNSLLKNIFLSKSKATTLASGYNASHLTRWFSDKTILSENNVATESALASISAQNVREPDKLYKVIEFECRSNDPAVLRSYTQFATMAANELGIQVGKCWSPRKAHHERYTLLRSIHVHKRCRVQYEVRTWFRFIHFHRLTGSTADTFLEYTQRNLPEGVALKVTKVSLEDLPESISTNTSDK
ncbi:28S ribosomal protein S10, mitochondrial [Adelges cooleyi]|uniref:28S ribosomal protein S10, mitochondrial n=1 Tax=Adelges cooleyi TaxID=133065 RepID=UPI00217FCC2A|nr:28S ribosomal protein S10, mitochondrial [Adelges cooleyi]